jgi:uncharacterized RDD family membrane protein YckC
MEPTELPNPYAPPSAGIDYLAPRASDAGAPLAGRWSRFGASLIDSLISMVPMIVAAIIGIPIMMSGLRPSGAFSDPQHPPSPDVVFQRMGPFFIALGVGLLGALGIGIFQCYRIATRGQSLAKQWLNIKIVKTDGTPVDFGSGVGLRAILPWFISNVPYIGWLFWLVDVCFIFRDDRRCIHDLMANTKVVEVVPE